MRSTPLAALSAVSLVLALWAQQAFAHGPAVGSIAALGPQHHSSLPLVNRVSDARQISNDIQLLKVTIKMLQERIKDYERFPREVFPVTLQRTRMCLLEAEQDLKSLRRARALLWTRGHSKYGRSAGPFPGS